MCGIERDKYCTFVFINRKTTIILSGIIQILSSLAFKKTPVWYFYTNVVIFIAHLITFSLALICLLRNKKFGIMIFGLFCSCCCAWLMVQLSVICVTDSFFSRHPVAEHYYRCCFVIYWVLKISLFLNTSINCYVLFAGGEPVFAPIEV